eukprot:1161210-Pelagomonas_calceolata.AAC.17
MVATEQSTSTAPSMLTRPWVGFSPTRPQKEEGIRMEPPPSLPTHKKRTCMPRALMRPIGWA